MYKKIALIFCSFIFLPSCSITQNIQPSKMSNHNELCIIENPDVREGFLIEFSSTLDELGRSYKVVSEAAIPTDCNWTATYIGKWSWDLSLYMAYAEIKVFHNGSLDGEAQYDSTNGSATMSKFIEAAPKIRELVTALFSKS